MGEKVRIEYYKHWADCDYGQGTAYVEVTDGWVTRQIEIYPEIEFWATATEKSHPNAAICDQPLERMGLSAEDRISAADFEAVWRKVRGDSQQR